MLLISIEALESVDASSLEVGVRSVTPHSLLGIPSYLTSGPVDLSLASGVLGRDDPQGFVGQVNLSHVIGYETEIEDPEEEDGEEPPQEVLSTLVVDGQHQSRD